MEAKKSQQRFTEVFKTEAVRQVTDRGHPVAEVAARLMRQASWRSQTGYARRPGFRSGKPAVVAPNHLKRALDVAELNTVWLTGITYIRTHEGWLYLLVVLDLFSRQIVGWSLACRGPGWNRRLADGGLAPKTRAGGAGAFRSGEPVQLPRLAGLPQSASIETEHEPARKLPRQCRG